MPNFIPKQEWNKLLRLLTVVIAGKAVLLLIHDLLKTDTGCISFLRSSIFN
jgi:hypothetical protein